jgi:hypothetical protein
MAAGHTAAAAVSHSTHQRGHIPADQVSSCYYRSRKIICEFRIFLFSGLISAANQPPILNTGKGENLYVYFAELILLFLA